jgi:hypothetical protein
METAMDLVDEMQWEDVIPAECMLSLEEAGLEESSGQPVFGGLATIANNIYNYTSWFYDGDDSAFGVM